MKVAVRSSRVSAIGDFATKLKNEKNLKKCLTATQKSAIISTESKKEVNEYDESAAVIGNSR